MNTMPATRSPARAGGPTCYTCCRPAAPKSLMNKDCSRFSRLVDKSSIRLGGYTGRYRYRGLTSTPAEPAEAAAIVPSQWVKDSRVVAAHPATCCIISPLHRYVGARVALETLVLLQPVADAPCPRRRCSAAGPTPRTTTPSDRGAVVSFAAGGVRSSDGCMGSIERPQSNLRVTMKVTRPWQPTATHLAGCRIIQRCMEK